jgi:hypothetical protein
MIGRLVDRALAAAVTRAGEPGGIRFTERQLYYELCRTLQPLHRLPSRVPFTLAPALRYPTFQHALRRHGAVPGLLTTPRELPPPGRHTTEPDLFDYGLPRMLICGDQEIANMLHANDLPMESGCPVFGMADLPLDPRLAGMLATAGDATIYLLHDASPAGLAMPRRVPELTEIPAGVRVVALGLRPPQAAALHLTRGRGPSGAFVEVAAVRPAVLLRAVHRLVRGVRRPRVWPEGLARARETGFMSWPRA